MYDTESPPRQRHDEPSTSSNRLDLSGLPELGALDRLALRICVALMSRIERVESTDATTVRPRGARGRRRQDEPSERELARLGRSELRARLEREREDERRRLLDIPWH